MCVGPQAAEDPHEAKISFLFWGGGSHNDGSVILRIGPGMGNSIDCYVISCSDLFSEGGGGGLLAEFLFHLLGSRA